jgi:asparagine synthetase B (glutamine-hydrolysing)
LGVGTFFVSSHAHSFAFLTRRKALRKVKKKQETEEKRLLQKRLNRTVRNWKKKYFNREKEEKQKLITRKTEERGG